MKNVHFVLTTILVEREPARKSTVNINLILDISNAGIHGDGPLLRVSFIFSSHTTF